MPRVIWKGAISLGLVHVPVALYPASQETGVDFDWLEKRSIDPVGYKRVNKRTGKEIKSEDVVKGVKLDDGNHVLLGEDEIKNALPKSTQTIEIKSFVKASEIPLILLEKPFYPEPIGNRERVYALLREAMLAAGVTGLARVVMHTKEHLAALVPSGSALILNTIRWASEVRSPAELKLPAPGKTGTSLKPTELKMAAQLIDDMTAPWKPESCTDTFTAAVVASVQAKRDAGKTSQVTALEVAPQQTSSSNVVDLTDLLAQSLAKRKPAADAAKVKAALTLKATARKTPAGRKRG